MNVSEAKRLRALEGEKAMLKRMLADAMLGIIALKDLLGKKGGRSLPSGGCVETQHGSSRRLLLRHAFAPFPRLSL